MSGRHSTIERPESVRRVIAPTMTIVEISAQQVNSQFTTALCSLFFLIVMVMSIRLCLIGFDTYKRF